MSQYVQQDSMNKNINTNITNNNVSNSSDNLKEQAAINSALINAGLPQNKINAFIEMAKDHLLCNSECQKQRESERLKKIWNDSKNNLKTAPLQVEVAEKNYYIFDKGYPKYQDMLFDRYSKTAEEMKQSSLLKHKTLLLELDALMQSYQAETIFSRRIRELLKVRKQENKQLKEDISNYIGTTQTDARKVDYTNMETSWLSSVKTVLLFIYYSLFVAYLLTSDYFKNEQYRDGKVWLMIILYLTFPRFVNWIVIQLYYMKKYIEHLFENRPYKNAYQNI